MSQERYWKEMYQLKVHINYLEAFILEAESYDRWIKIFSAVAASTSIGAWVIWREFSFVWAAIIAASQVVSAVKPYLPFQERRNKYSALLHDFEELFIRMEAQWFEIASSKLTEDEINSARTKIRLQKQKLLKKHLPTSVVPNSPDKTEKAENIAVDYFSTFHGD